MTRSVAAPRRKAGRPNGGPRRSRPGGGSACWKRRRQRRCACDCRILAIDDDAAVRGGLDAGAVQAETPCPRRAPDSEEDEIDLDLLAARQLDAPDVAVPLDLVHGLARMK